MGFPKTMGAILGVTVIRTIVFWGLYWGSPYSGKLPYGPYLQFLPSILGVLQGFGSRGSCLCVMSVTLSFRAKHPWVLYL